MSYQARDDRTGRDVPDRPSLRVVAGEDVGGYDLHAQVLDELDRVLDRLVDIHHDELQDGELTFETSRLAQAKRRIDNRTLETVAAITSRQTTRARQANPDDVHAGRKAATQVAQDLAGELRLDPRDAKRLVDDARDRRHLTGVSKDAATEGAVSTRHLSILHRQLLRHLADPGLRRRVETEMVARARELSPGAFYRACKRRLGELDRVANEVDDRVRDARRTGSVTSNDDGTVQLSATLAGVGAETVMTAVLAFTTRDDKTRPRTPGQRTADALVAMARAALDGGSLATHGGVKPHVTVFVGWQDLHDGGTAELGHTGPISTAAVRTLLDDCTITRVVTGPESQILDIGRTARTPTVAIWHGLIGRDRHCTYEDCTVPAARCQAAHFKAIRWIDGAPTALDEQALLCWTHHVLVDRLGLVGRLVNGKVIWERPDPNRPDRRPDRADGTGGTGPPHPDAVGPPPRAPDPPRHGHGEQQTFLDS